MKVNIKKLHPEAVIPAYAHNGDAGLDLTAVSQTIDADGCMVYGTGIAVEIPEGYVGLVFPRSSNSRKDLVLTNSVGVIDHGYTGEITVKFKPVRSFTDYAFDDLRAYLLGDRVAQLIIMPYPSIEFVEVAELQQTERGAGGYGSTGN